MGRLLAALAALVVSRASYVRCDRCGDPANISTDGAKSARVIAADEGFVRRDGKDLCGRCAK